MKTTQERQKRKYSVTVLPDNETEKFSKSLCDCKFCLQMHASNLEWETFKPNTRLQYRMKEIVDKLQNHGVDTTKSIPKFD
jgi:hypothetical protein